MVKVAAAQASPVWMDATATAAKTVDLVEDAAAQGVRLLAFGQSWLPGYPWATLLHPMTGSAPPGTALFHENAIRLDGPEMELLQATASRESMHIILGIAERADDAVYSSHVHITSSGEIGACRRATNQNTMELRVWTASASDVPEVTRTPLGTVGALASTDNLVRSYQEELLVLGEQLHIALWPGFGVSTDTVPASTALASARHYAVENGCYVVLAAPVTTAVVGEHLVAPAAQALRGIVPGGGAAAIYGPDGSCLTDPIPGTHEGLAIAEIDLSSLEPIQRPDGSAATHQATHPYTEIVPPGW